MSSQRYSQKLKDVSVRQVVDRGYSVAEGSERLGIASHSLDKRLKPVKPNKTEAQASELIEAKSGILKLRAQLRRTK